MYKKLRTLIYSMIGISVMPIHTTQAIDLRQKIGQMIMVGFDGTTIDNPAVKSIGQQIRSGSVGGIIFYKYNITAPQQIKKLTTYLSGQSPVDLPVLLAIDQEGGKVQRLSYRNGFKDFLSAQDVAQQLSPIEAEAYYNDMAKMTADYGFNLTFGPVVDLHKSFADVKADSVISKLNRSYSGEPQEVVAYATAFVNTHRHYHVLTSLKHFPGHGFAKHDSHKGMVDITNTHKAIELVPFQAMIMAGKVDMIMTAHLVHTKWDQQHPATLSSTILNEKLRIAMGYDGVIISDDLHMGAIGQHYSLQETVIKAIQAGCDILLFSNNQAAAQNVKESKINDNIVTSVIAIIEQAIQRGELSEQQINTSYKRIKNLKDRFKRAVD